MGEITSTLSGMKKDEVSPETARDFVTSLNKKIPSLCNKFEAEIEQMLKDVVVSQAKEYVEEYQQYVRDLVGEVNYDDDEKTARILGASASLTFEETLQRYEEEKVETIKVWEHDERNADYKWYDGIANIFRRKGNKKSKFITYEDFEDRKYTMVNFSKYISERVMPEIVTFADSTREIALDYAKKEEADFKDFFVEQLDMLEKKILETTEQKRQMLSEKDGVERLIEEYEKKEAWLQGFEQELKDILAVYRGNMMAINDSLVQAVEAKDMTKVRDRLWAWIAVDPSLSEEFKEAWDYCIRNGIAEESIYERHDGRPVDLEVSKDNFSRLTGELSSNFSRERLDAVRKMGKKLYVKQPDPSCSAAKPDGTKYKRPKNEGGSPSPEESGGKELICLIAGILIGAIGTIICQKIF